MDQQIYDVAPHKDTAVGQDKAHVLLSNRGLHVYASFTKVVILTKTHRLATIDDPQPPEDHAFNERAKKFVSVLRRVRDLEWTPEDCYWLCRRKRGQMSIADRKGFADAPVIMDFRRATENNPEDNCDCYNKAHLRAMAHKESYP